MGHGRKGREGGGAEEVAGVDDIKEGPAVVHLEVNVTGGTCLAQAEGNIQDGIILNEKYDKRKGMKAETTKW